MKSNPSRAVIELSINDQLVKIRPSTAACSGRLTKASSLNEIPSTSIPDGIYLVHRRKPWSLGERLRNLTPDFMDVRR
ncbi:hypothetical protein ACX84L_30335, partial [Burkholderia pseudomallei]|uniref:hypothetical protein n=1 Tax=Burkholderia pseudomallei TaxID=28450 RepID=UPI001C4B4963